MDVIQIKLSTTLLCVLLCFSGSTLSVAAENAGSKATQQQLIE